MEVNPKKSSDKSDQRYFENKLHLIDVDSAIGLWKDGTEWWTVLFWKQNQREPIKRFSPDANIQAGLVFWRKIGFQSPKRYPNNWNIFRLYGVRMRESEGALISYYYYFYYFHFILFLISYLISCQSELSLITNQSLSPSSGNCEVWQYSKADISGNISHFEVFVSRPWSWVWPLTQKEMKQLYSFTFILIDDGWAIWWWYIRGGWVATVGNYFVLSC